MTKLTEKQLLRERLLKEMELVYSPDDGGWYWQDYGSWKVSQLFETREEAEQAKQDGELIME